MNDIDYMKIAIEEAKKSLLSDDVPVGCVIVKDSEIIAKAYNCRERDSNATAHAEITAINQACNEVGSWRLHNCTIYVTLEPCPMCAGAIFNSRIPRVVYGLKNPKTGAMGSVLDFNTYPLTHKAEISVGICENECRELLQSFFDKLKKSNSAFSTVCH